MKKENKKPKSRFKNFKVDFDINLNKSYDLNREIKFNSVKKEKKSDKKK
jgi:hypothetical protein